VPVASLAVPAAVGFVMAPPLEIEEGLEASVRLDNDIAAFAAVAAVGAAARDEFFPVHTDAAVAAVAAFNRYFRFIYKH
jgi:hypothetical protein